jgi:hypothetical protein
MKLFRPRFTVRRVMLALIPISITIHLSVGGWRVYTADDRHSHTSVTFSKRGEPYICWNGGFRQAFWPRYWRYILGRPWVGQVVCQARPGHFEELCELAHPEIVRRMPHWPWESPRASEAQAELCRRLEEKLR